MKKTVLTILITVLILAAALTVCAQDETTASGIDRFRGVWASIRPQIEMIRKDGGYIALVHWGSSAMESTSWQYTLTYDEANDCLVADGNGIKGTTVFGNNGEESSYTEAYTDGSARFIINDNGKLIWEDGKEDAGNGIEFEKIDSSYNQPTAEELTAGYFQVVGGYHQGVSGSSLAAAQAAYRVYDFAQSHQLWTADVPTLRDDLLKAFEGLSDEDRSAFDANFMSIVRLLDGCEDDWEANRGVFSDAGVPMNRMEYFLTDPAAKVSWDILKANTLTMGNSDN